MNCKRLMGTAASVLASVGIAHAEPEVQILPETVVKANRVPVPSKEVGSSVSVITSEELDRRQTRFVADSLRNVPGVAVNRSGPVGLVTQVRIRGAEGNHTQVVIDGVVANDPSNDFEFNFAHLLAEDIERIEVIRGPQSALWGSEALGGVINVITKRGREGLNATGYLEAGSFDTVSGNAALSGAGNNYRFSASGTFLTTNGVNMSRFGSEDDGYENKTVNLTGSVEPTEMLEFSINGRFVNSEVQSDPQDFGFGNPTAGLTIDGDDVRKSDQFYGRAQGKLKLYSGAWEHIVGGNYSDNDNKNLTNGLFVSAAEGTTDRLDYQSNVYFSTPNFASAEHTAIVYLEHVNEDFTNQVADPTSTANQKKSLTRDSIAGEYRIGLWQRAFLSGSIRHDENDFFKDSTTWRTTASFLTLGGGPRLHFSMGTGVKNPGFFDLFAFFPLFFEGNPDLTPEESFGWDFGIEQHLFKGRMVFDLTYFQNDLEDEIVSVFNFATGRFKPINQVGKSKRKGVEFSTKARITESTDLAATYTYTDAKDPDGRIEVRRPEHIASLVVNQRFAGERGNVNLNIRYNGDTEDNEFVPTTARDRVTLNNYTLVDVAASYQLDKRVQLFGRVENLLDEDYEEVFSVQSPGIGVFGGVRVNFGLR